jgi:hypothetical protein
MFSRSIVEIKAARIYAALMTSEFGEFERLLRRVLEDGYPSREERITYQGIADAILNEARRKRRKRLTQ